MVNVIYPLCCCVVVANVAIGAARLTINTDLSASSTVRLGSDDNEDASGLIRVKFLVLKSMEKSICAYLCM